MPAYHRPHHTVGCCTMQESSVILRGRQVLRSVARSGCIMTPTLSGSVHSFSSESLVSEFNTQCPSSCGEGRKVIGELGAYG
jgi:hypothetical protein